ncbi:MAG: gliding motility-associated C-terminal domain-containing protein [Saprospiraceae bacterium]|nr:gliding motility-associated C-terminal domain-containing protein [Saprospiraceae bacterium]
MCDQNPRVTFVETRENGTCVGSYKLIRTWTATDACGNSSTASQTISVGDTDGPILVGVPTNTTLNCNETVPSGAVVTSTDACDPSPRVVMSDNTIRGNCVGSYKIVRTWTATDACGNTSTASQEISVGDNAAPVFANVPTNLTVNCTGGSVPTPITPSVSDLCDQNPRVTFVETRENGTCVGSYKLIRTWTATDACGNSSTASQTISVGDTDGPILVGVPTNTTLNCNETVPSGAVVTSTDACDPSPRVVMSDNTIVEIAWGSYKIVRTWTATDACGNTSTASQEISVGDNAAPVFANVPTNLTVNCTGGSVPTAITPSVSDLCDQNPRVTFVETRENGTCVGSYKLIRTWTATDACGNSSTASQTISVGDTDGPILVGVPTNTTLNCNETVPSGAVVTSTDACDPSPRVVMSDNTIRGNCVGSYKIVRTWTATDACGNTSTASQEISVGDNAAPVFANVPTNLTVNCTGGSVPTAITPSVSDLCDQNPRVTFVETRENGTCVGSYKLIRTWTATDACGNSSTASQTISVGDTDGPILVGVPTNTTLNCNETVPSGAVVTSTDACDPSPRVVMSDNTIRGNCVGSYKIVRTWTATDACGNTSTASQEISVGDNAAPVFANVPTNLTVNCTGGSVPTAITPSVSDLCDQNPRVTFVETRENGTCVGSYKLIRTWTATDACGNSSTASQTISVGDTDGPILVGVPTNTTLNCNETVPSGAVVTSTDACDPSPRVVMSDNTIRGNCVGSYKIVRTWTATDACGNTSTASQEISVGDNAAPVFANVPTNLTVNCTGGSVPTAITPSVSDLCDQNPRVTFVETRENGTCVGSYKLIRTWTATDACGNSSTASQTISVGDTDGPILVGVPTNTTLNCNETVPSGAVVTSTDACDPSPRVVMSDNTIRGNCVGSYKIVRTWTATDACGNTSTASQEISVGDNAAPVFANVPTNLTVNCTGGSVPTAITPSVSDLCDQNPRVTFVETRENGTCVGSYKLIRTWTATDACGNSSTASQTISVGDTDGPILVGVPTNTTLNCNETVPSGAVVTSTDACDPSPRVVMSDNTIRGNCVGSYKIVRTWTATDACGNTSTASQEISVGDNAAPVFANVPTNLTVNCTGGSVPTAITPSVSDLCDQNPRVTFVETRENGTCVGSYKLIRTWTATDACGNSSTASQTISVGDTDGPILVGVPTNTTLNCNETVPSGAVVTSTDACDPSPRVVMSDNTIRGNCVGSYKIVRTWTATDACGNTSTASQEISVGDNAAPVFANVPTNLTVNCTGGSVPTAITPSVSDLCDQNPRVTFVETRENGTCVGSYKLIRTWTATDACGNSSTASQTISVGDTDGPILVGVPTNTTLNCNETVPSGAVVTSTDACDPSPRVVMSDNTIRGNCVGSYKIVRTWTATDACGNTSTASQEISVGDNAAPVFASVPIDLTVECGGLVPNPPTVTATDVCDANPRVTMIETRQSGTCDDNFVLTRTWTATDACGNTKNQAQTITVKDEINPELVNVPQDITINVSTGQTIPTAPTLQATDNCDNTVAVIYRENRVVGAACGYALVRTWIAIDNCGNRDAMTQTITVIDGVDNAQPTGIAADNCGRSDGKVRFTPSTYGYRWADGRTDAVRTDLKAGTYSVTVENQTGCSKVIQVTIPSACACEPPVVQVQKNDTPCEGGGNGSATILVSNGNVANFKFIWTPNVSTSNIGQNLPAGEYRVRIEKNDNADCFSEKTFQISAPNRINYPEPQITKANCTSPNGVFEFSILRGTENYRFRWSTGDTGRIRRNLAAGSYTVTISDTTSASICPLVKTLEMPSTNPLRTDYAVNREPSCNQANGDVTLTTTGGSGNYIYSWGEGNRRYVLASGAHTVTTTDVVTGCQTTVSFNLMNIAVTVDVQLDTLVSVSCNRVSDGRINLTLSNYGANFVQPAVIEFKDDLGNYYSNGALPAGLYWVEIKDATGCVAARKYVRVAEPAPLTVTTIEKRNFTCDTLGVIKLTVTGGNRGNLTYKWSDLGNQNNQPQVREDLLAGFYTATISDAAGCQTIVRNIQIKDSCICRPPVVDSIAVTAARCGINNGAATLTLVGGNESRYQFVWTPSIGTANALGNTKTGLTSGAYNVLVRLRSNPTCFANITVGVGNVEGPKSVTASTTAATCELANGTALLRSTEPDLEYLWMFDNSTAAQRSDLKSGFYQVQVTKISAPECPSVISVRIDNKNELKAVTTVSRKATCNGSNGAASITVTGGSGNYTYVWGNSTATTATRNDLRAGIYNVKVLDTEGGCQASTTFAVANEVVGQTTVQISEPVVYVSCTGNRNGHVNYQVVYSPNFVAPAKIEITDATGRVFGNDSLPVGNYCVVIKDGNGCVVVGSQCFTVLEPQKMLTTIVKANKTCTVGGRISVIASGGTGAPLFTWGDVSGVNQLNSRVNLDAGSYRVTVSDAKGCTVVLDSIILKNECTTQSNCTLEATAASTERTCTEGGEINLTISGGTVPYRYDWADLVGTSNAPNRDNLEVGIYSVIITDAANCKDTVSDIRISNACTQDSTRVCTSPIIANSQIVDSRCGQQNGEIRLTLSRTTATTQIIWTPNVGNTAQVSGLAAGVYRVKIINNNQQNCAVEQSFVIRNQDGVPVTTASITPAVCGLANGKADFANIGTALSYTWSDGGRGKTRADLAAATYFVTVTDPAGNVCDQIMKVVIPASNPMTATGVIDTRATCREANGAATIRVSGGSGNYTYSWGTSATKTGLAAGAYNVTVTDNTTGCTAVSSLTMTNELAASATIAMPQTTIFVSCAGNTDASLRYDLSYSTGFAQPARVEIRTANTLARLAKNDSLAAGRYVLTVFDGNNCVAASQNFEVKETQPIAAQATALPQTCTNHGSITLQVSGGSGVFTYKWSDLGNQSNQPQHRLDVLAGTYAVTVVDSRSCNMVVSNLVVRNDSVGCNTCQRLATATSSNRQCTEMGKITVSTFGGNAPYRFDWLDVAGDANTQNRIGLGEGTYTVIVTDARGCRDTLKDINILNDCNSTTCNTVAAAIASARTCTEGGKITLQINGGSAPYSFDWSDLAGSFDPQNRTALAAGTYAVIVTDARNCRDTVRNIIVKDDCPRPVCTLVATDLATPKTCTATGGVNLTVNGGRTPYKFVWSDLGTQANQPQNRVNLPVGTYKVTITDALGCDTAFTQIIVKDEARNCGGTNCSVVASATPTAKTCTEGGKITLAVNGSTDVVLQRLYTFDWLDMAGTSNVQNRTGLSAATYTVVVRDSANCKDTLTIEILNECTTSTTCNLAVVATAKPKTCTSAGAINLTINASTDVAVQRLYHWADLTGANQPQNRNNLAAGVYRVTVSESTSCDTIIQQITVRDEALNCGGNDTCKTIYAGATILSAPDCNGSAQLCTRLEYLDFEKYTITDNGYPIDFSVNSCDQDTLQSYNYFSLVRFYPSAPWTLNAWTVDNQTFSGQMPTIEALVDSMNLWDATGNWTLEKPTRRIIGGGSRKVYGSMTWTKLGRTIATLNPNTHFVPNQLSVRLDTGMHRLVFVDTTTQCREVVNVEVRCPAIVPVTTVVPILRNSRIDTTILVGDVSTLCLTSNVPANQTTIVNSTPNIYKGFAGYDINDRTDCIRLLGVGVGRDTISLKRCYLAGQCDTTLLIVTVKNFLTPSDTSCVGIRVDQTQFEVNCGEKAVMCTSLFGSDTLNYTISVDGRLYRDAGIACQMDTISWYNYFSLVVSNPRSPWHLDSWGVDGRTHSATIGSMAELVDSMNVWDNGGNWRLIRTNFTIEGGVTGRYYGAMKWSKNGFNIASFELNMNFNIRKLGISLDTGRHVVTFYNNRLGCADTIRAVVSCSARIPQALVTSIDTTIQLGKTETFCFVERNRSAPSETSVVIGRAPNGNVHFDVNDEIDCSVVRAVKVGRDTVCAVRTLIDGSTDSLTIRMKVVKPNISRIGTVVKTIVVGEESTYCVEQNEVVGRRLTLKNNCEPNTTDNVNFVLNNTCVQYFADEVGSDTACLILTDEYGYADTTYLIVNVQPNPTRKKLPIAIADKAITAINTAMSFEVTKNDTTYGDAKVFLLGQPKHGAIVVNPATGIVKYTPNAGNCEPRDSFYYALVNAAGSDTTIVRIEVICDDVVVFSGFSPNGDGINDNFTIVGLDKYKKTQLLVFNRFGNQVLESNNYQNDWSGTFDGKPLPDGTYFWMLDLGGGKTLSGYVQMHR